MAWIVMLVLLLIANQAKSQDPEYDEINVSLQVQNIGNAQIPALIRDQEVLLPVSDLFDYLKVKTTLSAGMDSVFGFFLTPQATYLINRSNNKITFQGKTFNLKPGDLVRTETNLYMLSKYFGEIFGLDCRFSIRNLAVNISTKLELPMMREMRLALLRQNISKLRGETSVDTVIPRQHPLLHFGNADWSVVSTQEIGQRTDTRFNLSLGGVVLGGEVNGMLTYNTSEPFNERQQYYYWRFVNNDRRFLRQTTIGKIATESVSSIYNPVVGIRLTNTPTTYRRSFGTYPLSDYTSPGWMVELYVNNVLVDYKKADASGFFSFEVPLVYGNSAVKLKFYGPWGEERSKEQQISIPFNFLPAKEFEYTLNAGMVEDGMQSIFTRAAMNYGVSRGITFGAGVEYLSSVTTGTLMPFASLATRPFSNVLLSGEYVYGVRGKGIFSYQLPGNIQFEADYTKYHPGQKAVNFNYLEERKAMLSVPVATRNFSFYNRMTFNQVILPGTGYSTAEWLISGALFGLSTNLTNYAMFLPDGDPYVYSNLSFSIRLPHRLLLIPQAQYEYSHKELISARASLEKYVFKNGFLSVSFDENFKSNIQSMQLGFRYDLPFAQTGFNARRMNNQTTTMEMARGSLVTDARNHYAGFNSRVNVGKGGIVFSPYLDLNCNNRRDPDEPKAKGLNIRINGGNIIENERDTTVRVTDLEPYVKYYVELDANSFDNVAYKLRMKAMSVTADPNMFAMVDIPIAVVGEAAGTVTREKGASEEGMGRIILNIFDKKGNLAGRALSEQDGYFSYLGLAPGEYIIKVDSAQQKKLNLKASPESRDITILKTRDGDIVEGLDFILTSTIPVTAIQTPMVHAAPVPTVEASKPVVAVQLPAAQKSAEEPAGKSMPTTEPVPVKVKTSPDAPFEYFVQPGAFREKNNADSFRKKLAEKYSYPAVIVEESNLYRLRVGPFKSFRATEYCKVALQKDGIDCFILKVSVP